MKDFSFLLLLRDHRGKPRVVRHRICIFFRRYHDTSIMGGDRCLIASHLDKLFWVQKMRQSQKFFCPQKYGKTKSRYKNCPSSSSEVFISIGVFFLFFSTISVSIHRWIAPNNRYIPALLHHLCHWTSEHPTRVNHKIYQLVWILKGFHFALWYNFFPNVFCFWQTFFWHIFWWVLCLCGSHLAVTGLLLPLSWLGVC